MGKFLQKLKEISEGWYYDEFPTEDIIKMAEPRAAICAECPLNKHNTCNEQAKGKAVRTFTYLDEVRTEGKEYPGCGCPLSKKTKSPSTKCPLGKW